MKTITKRIIVTFSLLFLLALNVNAQTKTFSIPYESKGQNVTMTYKEIIQYCRLTDSLYSEVVFKTFGKSAQGDDLPYLMIDDGSKTADKITLWIQAGIHPGEPEGVEAGFLFLRDLMTKPEMKPMLRNVRVLFIPCFNVDGLKRFGQYNRINQNGPEQMGWRTTAQNLNLNRDFMKADAPEMQAWLKLYNEVNPDFLIDCHTTDGADYQYAVTYGLDAFQTLNQVVASWCTKKYVPYITDKMNRDGLPIFPYVAFRQWHNPRSGLLTYGSRPMLSHGYTILTDRPCLLIETHMLKPYKVRVESTLQMIHHTFTFLAENRESYRSMLRGADQERISDEFLNAPFPIGLETSMKDSTIIDFLGMEFDTIKSGITGGVYYKYDNTKPVTWKIPLFGKVYVSDSITLPLAYVIPVEWNDVIERVKLHGISVIRINDNSNIKVAASKLNNVKFPGASYEGRFRPEYNIMEFDTTVNIPEGSSLVLVKQPKIKVLVWLLDAASEDSFLKWGFFNAIFEQKEYGEMYVLEPMAEKMFAENPALKAEFEALKKNDPAFASNQWLQMNWVYNHTVYRDRHYCVYPVLKITDQNELKKLLPEK
ncbi:Zinc carboxypeptidase [anaerobic digester metagenome]